jgi:hypothetical protein
MARTPEYKDIYADKALSILAEGKSKNAVCAHIGISKQTLYNWEKNYPDFKEAVDIGMAACEYHWEELGADGIIADGFNTGMWMIQMRNRFGWKATDPKEQPETDKSGIAAMTEAFVAAQIALNEVEKMKA